MRKSTKLFRDLIKGLEEVRAHLSGDTVLPTYTYTYTYDETAKKLIKNEINPTQGTDDRGTS
jgi:hypothetical protein